MASASPSFARRTIASRVTAPLRAPVAVVAYRSTVAEFEAIFDEAIMTNRWKNLTTKYNLRFLPIDGDILQRLERKGWKPGVLPKGTFRGVDEDVPGIDFTGWYLFCRQDIDEELAYLTVRQSTDSNTRSTRCSPTRPRE